MNDIMRLWGRILLCGVLAGVCPRVSVGAEGSACATVVQDTESRFSLAVSVVDTHRQRVPSAVVMVEPYGVWGITDDEGRARIANIPFNSQTSYQVAVSLLGYKSVTVSLTPRKGLNKLEIVVEEESIAMKEIVVVAENRKSGESTASKIGRQAINHLQATNLDDILQLLPGQVSMSNPSLTGTKHFNSRSLYNNAFSSSVVIDGVPLSGNSAFDGNSGVDLRNVGADDIESVEVIRGIASAEYGDVAAGTMIVNSKIGVTDLNLRAKIMPGIMQFYVGKGFKAGRWGNINLSADYARGKSDPRYKTDTYDRVLAGVAHSKDLFDGKWRITTKVNFTATKDWSGADPSESEAMKKFFSVSRARNWRVSHSGRINFNRLFARTVKYDLSYQNNTLRSRDDAFEAVGGGSIFDAVEDGMYEGKVYPYAYSTSTGVRSNPVMYYAKISDVFDLNAGRFLNKFNTGVEFSSEGNEGTGRYDAGEYPSFAEGRVRRYCDIPYLNRLSLYVEDRFTLPLGRGTYPSLRGQVGVRWSMIQPGRTESMNSFSPRVNLSLHLAEWLTLRGGYGQSEKLPSLAMLYPDKGYFDFYNMSVTNGSDRYYLYSTRVFDRTAVDLRPMKNNKWEAALDVKLRNGMSFSLVGYRETVKNGFGLDNSEWMAMMFDCWEASDVHFEGSKPVYDPQRPSYSRPVLINVTRPGNTGWERNRGLEFDFDFGKIRATNTAFYLNGAYTVSESHARTREYNHAVGDVNHHTNVYVVYPEGCGSTYERRRFSAALRVVQHIPAIKFVVSATAQFVFHDYDKTVTQSERPIGYITDDHRPEGWIGGRGEVFYTEFTPEQFADPEYRFEGFLLRDQVYDRILSNRPTKWPSVWTLNLRVTKEITRQMGFSFYANNLFFHQPWQRASTSTVVVERNASLFSYGLEMFVHF